MLPNKLNQSGHAHLVMAFVVAVLIGVAGVRLLQASHAEPIGQTPVVHAVTGRKGLPGIPEPDKRAHAASDTGASPGYFLYARGFQFVTASGATVQLNQAKPKVNPKDYHSLAELAVESYDSKQVVEIGWTIDRAITQDPRPKLFVFHWVNGTPTCYNGCGYVQTSHTVYPGAALKAGKMATFRIAYSASDQRWWLSYGGRSVGYFPASLWKNTFTQAGLVQVFGEVSASTFSPCTQMGTGYFGDTKGSSMVRNFGLIGAHVPASLIYSVTNPSYYNVGLTTPTSFQFGGPGYCGPVKP